MIIKFITDILSKIILKFHHHCHYLVPINERVVIGVGVMKCVTFLAYLYASCDMNP